MKSILIDSKTEQPIELPDNPYKGLTHLPKGSALEGLRIPTREDSRKSAERLKKAFEKGI